MHRDITKRWMRRIQHIIHLHDCVICEGKVNGRMISSMIGYGGY